MDYVLHVGPYILDREDARNINRLYRDEHLTLWQIKVQHYPLATLNEIAMGIQHGWMDSPRNQVANFMFNSEDINISAFRYGRRPRRPSVMNYVLHVGSYIFTREDARNIDRLYRGEHLTLWQIKEQHYPMANLNEIAMGIEHGWMDLPRSQVADYMFSSDEVDMNAYNIGQPSLKWYRNREGQGRPKIKY